MKSSNHSQAEALLPLSIPVFQILISLSDRDLHGYALIGDIRQHTNGEVNLSTSTLYGAIKRMMRDGLIQKSDIRPAPESDDERRRYYRVTDLGRQVAHCEARRIARLAELVRDKQFVIPTP